MKRFNLAYPLLLLTLYGCSPDSPPSHPIPTAPSTQPSTDPAWPIVATTMQRRGILIDNVYTVTIPRDDLDISIEGMEVPTAAGMQSTFWFYRCPCGKMNVAGQFLLADYESNDVIDALRARHLKIASIAPALLYEKPRVLIVRFQGEGDPTELVKSIREALRWTGKERMAPRKME